jgi:hypothetical protein
MMMMMMTISPFGQPRAVGIYASASDYNILALLELGATLLGAVLQLSVCEGSEAGQFPQSVI